MLKVVALLLLVTALSAEAVPDWVIRGILSRESSSYYLPNGKIKYVDRRIGDKGERGPFQMKRIAFDTVSLPGESFERLGWDTYFAERIARRYLLWIKRAYKVDNWMIVVSKYNLRPSYRGPVTAYARDVYERGTSDSTR